MLFCLLPVSIILAGSVRISLVIELGNTRDFETNKNIPMVQSEQLLNWEQNGINDTILQ